MLSLLPVEGFIDDFKFLFVGGFVFYVVYWSKAINYTTLLSMSRGFIGEALDGVIIRTNQPQTPSNDSQESILGRECRV